MRHLVIRAAVSIVALAMLAPFFAPAASAASVTAWVETASKTPGAGCAVDVSVEVRSDGGALSGAEVTVSLSQDGTSNVISRDSSTTNGSGMAWLTIDTSAGWNGMKGWMEVAVNGSYLGGQTIWVTDGSCSGNSTLVEMNGSASTTLRGGSAPAASSSSAASADSGKVIIPNVVAYQQQRGLSCEYSALSIATGALGDWVSEYEFESVVPLNDNPHWGYRGDITGKWGNTDDYGVYAGPLVPALEHFGFQGDAWYGDQSDLMAAIDRGEPTLVWVGMGGDLSHNEYASDGTRYQLTQYMHVMVAYGYDDGGVYISDPGTGKYKYYSWADFNWMWQVMDGMALSVSW
jgi:uncharacterized protein YvpB